MTTEAFNSSLCADLVAVLPNTWARQLPAEPGYPAAVFDIVTAPEPGWANGAGYDRHDVSVVIISTSRADVLSIAAQMREAMESRDDFMALTHTGDAEYEPDPGVYAWAITAEFRSPNWL